MPIKMPKIRQAALWIKLQLQQKLPKRDAENAILNTSANFSKSNEPTGSSCCHNFLTVTPSYHRKVNLVSPLDAQTIAEAVLLYVFIIAFPACLLFCNIDICSIHVRAPYIYSRFI